MAVMGLCGQKHRDSNHHSEKWTKIDWVQLLI